MAVTALGDFTGIPRDTLAHFHGGQLVYLGWDRHLMFYAPLCFCVPPSMRLGELIHGPAAGLWSSHPDWHAIDWSRAEWLRSGEPFSPDLDRSLADNGIGHKEIVRLRTPGLDGIAGSGS
jgi:phenol/toluene 2-monooxygenase (NADH) P4/A4